MVDAAYRAFEQATTFSCSDVPVIARVTHMMDLVEDLGTRIYVFFAVGACVVVYEPIAWCTKPAMTVITWIVAKNGFAPRDLLLRLRHF